MSYNFFKYKDPDPSFVLCQVHKSLKHAAYEAYEAFCGDEDGSTDKGVRATYIGEDGNEKTFKFLDKKHTRVILGMK